ncbi:hypothetical protein D3C81_1307460 [compost metagenome]
MGKRGLSVTIVTEQQTFIMRKFARELDIQLEERAMSAGKALPADEARRLVSSRGNGGTDGLRRESAAPGSSKPVRTAAVQPDAAGARPAAARQGLAGGLASGGEVRREPHHGAGQAAGGRSQAAPAGKTRSSSSEREKNRKNKGAPKWLKNKTPRGDGQ